MDGTSVKSERLLQIYSRLVSGDVLPKKELAQQFHVTERSIQRDMESLRCFFAEQGLRQDIVYDTGWSSLPYLCLITARFWLYVRSCWKAAPCAGTKCCRYWTSLSPAACRRGVSER